MNCLNCKNLIDNNKCKISGIIVDPDIDADECESYDDIDKYNGMMERHLKNKLASEKRRTENFLRYNDTDCFGMCFSDADPGL